MALARRAHPLAHLAQKVRLRPLLAHGGGRRARRRQPCPCRKRLAHPWVYLVPPKDLRPWVLGAENASDARLVRALRRAIAYGHRTTLGTLTSSISGTVASVATALDSALMSKLSPLEKIIAESAL